MEKRFQTCSRCETRYQKVEDDGLCPKCILTTLFPDHAAPEAGDSGLEIPGLTVREVIGEGGFGRVYLAEQETVFQRRVAVKVLKAGLDTEAVLRRFEIEQRALSLLEHPHIARIYDVGETVQGHPYFTMEYVDGIPFTDYFSACPLNEVLEAMVLVCQAVSYAHERGLIHRDLKPSNILIAENGMPKVIDFGIAKATNPERTPGMTHLTMEESFLGTPDYMAPEQARLDSIALDERVDVFALGAVLFETLFGKSPLETSGGKRSRDDVADFRIEDVDAAVWQEYSRDLKKLLQKCLQEPEHRYHSASELRADLQRLVDGLAIEVDLPRPRSRRWLLYGLGGVAAAGTGTFFLKQRGNSLPEKTRLKATHYQMSGVARSLYLSVSTKRALSIFKTGSNLCLLNLENGELLKREKWGAAIPQSGCFSWDEQEFFSTHSDGTMRRFRASDGNQVGTAKQLLAPSLVRGIHCWGERLVNGEPMLMVREFDEKAVRAFDRNGKPIWTVKTPSACWGMEFQPNGSKIAFSGMIGQVCLMDLATQDLKVLKQKSRKGKSAGQTLPGDGGFFIAYYDGVVEHWSWEGQKIRQWRVSAGGEIRLKLSPDGKRLALIAHSAEAFCWDVAGQEEVRTVLLEHSASAIHFSPDSRELAIGCGDGSIRFWNPEENQLKESRLKIKSRPYSVQYSPLNKDLIFVTSSNGGVSVFYRDGFS